MAAPTTSELKSAEPMPESTGHKPYVPDKANLPEFTFSAVFVGAILGIIFGASSLYLVLKVGLTVSASIPVAVLSITLFRVVSKLGIVGRANILENNIVQTTGSAGESIAFGVGVTMPALMLLGFEMDIGRVMVVSILGGLLGILMMIPLRRAFIVKQHGILKYPEGTACAEVLIVGEKGGATAKTVFIGFGMAFIYQFLWQGFKFWKDTPSKALTWFKGAVPAIEVNPALLGVGYIIGTRISCVMVAGGVLASFVLIPAIRLFGDGLSKPIFPATKLIKDMGEDDIWHEYILYIGAGCVAAGGIISLFQALPLILSSMKAGLSDIRSAQSQTGEGGTARTDRDLPLGLVGIGAIVLVIAIWLTRPLHEVVPWIPDLHMNPLGAILIVLFGFLFVTVSSRITGEIGSSSNPISGMTVATLLLTCLTFLVLGWTHPEDRLTALSVAAVVCIAASNGGTTSQDLKTGYLVGATPKWQQLAILVGALSSALVIGWILIMINDAGTIYSSRDLPVPSQPVDVSKLSEKAKAPDDDTPYYVWRVSEGDPSGVPQGKYLVDDQGKIRFLVDPGINGKRNRKDDGTEVIRFKAPKAQLMSLITDGILTQKLPWALVLLGVSIALVLELCGVPSLPFAVGVYLPLSSSTPIFMGGLVRYIADRAGRWTGTGPTSQADSDSSPGVLLSTGYIAGGAIGGVVIAFLSFSADIPPKLAQWQYRQEVVSQPQTLEELAAAAAVQELGVAGTSQLSDQQAKDVAGLADEIKELNVNRLPRYVSVPAGTILNLNKNETYPVTKDERLGDIAQQVKGTPDKAALLLELNKDKLHLPERLPAGATLLLPQWNSTALVAFGVLVVFLILVGMGWLLRAPPATGSPFDNGNPPGDEGLVGGDIMDIAPRRT
jgi:putative OPT family oligopeptide transporter